MFTFRYKGDSKEYEVDFTRMSATTVGILGSIPVKTSGFYIKQQGVASDWDYTAYNTIYRIYPNGVEFSNDGSVYAGEDQTEFEAEQVAMANLTTPDMKALKLDKLRSNKVTQMNDAMTALIDAGVDVTLADGTVERFTLTANDQLSLVELQMLAESGALEEIPWHNSDHDEGCKYYSKEDFKLISATTIPFITYHVTYFRDLRRYINSLTDEISIDAVTYGMTIPMAYRSAVLNMLIANQRAKAKGGDEA